MAAAASVAPSSSRVDDVTSSSPSPSIVPSASPTTTTTTTAPSHPADVDTSTAYVRDVTLHLYSFNNSNSCAQQNQQLLRASEMQTTLSEFETITAQFLQEHLLQNVFGHAPTVAVPLSSGTGSGGTGVVDVAIEVHELWSSSSSTMEDSSAAAAATKNRHTANEHPHHVRPPTRIADRPAGSLQNSSSSSGSVHTNPPSRRIRIRRRRISGDDDDGNVMRVQFDAWVLHPRSSSGSSDTNDYDDDAVRNSVLDAFRTGASTAHYIDMLHDANREAFGGIQSVALVKQQVEEDESSSSGGEEDFITVSAGVGGTTDDGTGSSSSSHNVLTLVAIGGSCFIVLCLGVFAVRTMRRAAASGDRSKHVLAADDFIQHPQHHPPGGITATTGNTQRGVSKAAGVASRAMLYDIPRYSCAYNDDDHAAAAANPLPVDHCILQLLRHF